MQKESLITKILFFLNKVLALMSFLAYILPFLAPKLFPFLSVLTLLMPLFLILNFLFFIFWILQLKAKALLSAIVLLIGITITGSFYKFSDKKLDKTPNEFSLMSFNVRLFNLYKWLPIDDVPKQISDVVQGFNPDILCLQEFSPNEEVRLRNYQHKYINIHGGKNKYGQAIFSKFEIVNQGEIDFPNSTNNVIYADVVKKNDTIRVYSMHLQSIKISTDIHETLDENKSKFIFKRISEAFKEQQLQSELIKKHYEACKYDKIICGDMNNSAFSYVYRNIKGIMKDSFDEAGFGFGATYNFKYYPARIDYIFVEKNIQVNEFKVLDSIKLSDHYPIFTRLELKEK